MKKTILFGLLFIVTLLVAEENCDIYNNEFLVKNAKVKNIGNVIVQAGIAVCETKIIGIVKLYSYTTLRQLPVHISKVYLKVYEPSLSHYYAYADTKRTETKYTTSFNIPRKINNKKIAKLDIIGIDFPENIFIE